MSKYTKEFIASKEFLLTYEWRKVRMEALVKYESRCMCCGKSPIFKGVVINVDHIKPRKLFPELALDINNLQVLCNECNHGKGNWDETDWRVGEYFTITVDWLNANRTVRGAYTGAQIKILSPYSDSAGKGWVQRLVGVTIPGEVKEAFEKSAFIFAKDKKKEKKPKVERAKKAPRPPSKKTLKNRAKKEKAKKAKAAQRERDNQR